MDFGPKSGLRRKNRDCVWCILDVSSVFLSDARVVGSHGVAPQGPGSIGTCSGEIERKDGLCSRDAKRRLYLCVSMGDFIDCGAHHALRSWF